MIDEVDQFGNLETGDNTTRSPSLATGNGTLLGTTTETLLGGVATFVGLADKTAGIISLNFAGGGFTAGPSNNVFVSPGAGRSVGDPDSPVFYGDGRKPTD